MGERAWPADPACLDFASIRRLQGAGGTSVADLIMAMVERSSDEDTAGIWIHRATKDEVSRQIDEAEQRRRDGAELRLFGLAFAVKDNIDVAGMPTTAACPAFSHVPERSAAVVQRLLDAGAIVLGKTNLDQFATGLVGTRSPYGVPRNPFGAHYIPGGSSSGSAVAVARGLACFALGTDTAGSGRIPAAFNNIVGLKPSRGTVSTVGVVPACRSLDCVSIFALTCEDAWRVLQVAQHFDPRDPFARPRQVQGTFDQESDVIPFRFGVPGDEQLEFYGDNQNRALFSRAIDSVRALGGQAVHIDFSPFRRAAQLLYEGPWVAERLLATEALLTSNPDAVDPAVRTILSRAQAHTAEEVFRAQAELNLLSRTANDLFRQVDAMLVPTAPTIYTVDQIRHDPIELNTNLGYYTNYANLLDLCALAVPAGFRPDGLPFGVTLVAPWGRDATLAHLGARVHAEISRTLGASSDLHAFAHWTPESATHRGGLSLAVVGAHLSGEPLNHQLTSLGARFVERTRTAPCYGLFELPNSTPPKPGLVRRSEGVAIEVEIWWLPDSGVARFIDGVAAPLCIGTIELETGKRAHGFLCEHHAVACAKDISSFGGWKAYRQAKG